MIGQQIDSYRIEAPVGVGGMGVVYRARHQGLDRAVAIKCIVRDLCGNQEALRRFKLEAKLMAGFDHPNIVRVFDCGEANGSPYLVMELLHGETLRDRIKKGPIAEADVVRIITPILSALAYLHARSIVHRDIKSSNIFLCHDGAVKLMDFGIARAGSESRLTTTGALMGTAEYMSPEQIEGRDIDGRSDLYSVGIMMYEMLTGQAPFVSSTPLSILHMHLTRPPAPLPARFSSTIRNVINHALAKPVSDRIPSADQMLAAMSRKRTTKPANSATNLQPQNDVSVKAPPLTPSEFLAQGPFGSRSMPTRSRRKLHVFAAFGVFVICSFLLVWFAVRLPYLFAGESLAHRRELQDARESERQGDWEKAREQYLDWYHERDNVSWKPQMAGFFDRYGRSQEAYGDHWSALTLYNMALQYEPGDTFARSRILQCEQLAIRETSAKPAAERAAEDAEYDRIARSGMFNYRGADEPVVRFEARQTEYKYYHPGETVLRTEK
jgi:serine/threonine protein kinase